MAKVYDFKKAKLQKIIRQYAEFYHVDIKVMEQEEDTRKQESK